MFTSSLEKLDKIGLFGPNDQSIGKFIELSTLELNLNRPVDINNQHCIGEELNGQILSYKFKFQIHLNLLHFPEDLLLTFFKLIIGPS